MQGEMRVACRRGSGPMRRSVGRDRGAHDIHREDPRRAAPRGSSSAATTTAKPPAIFSLSASARLHKLDPELYLRDILRVVPHWPRERFLELAPRYWPITRSRLDARELDAELGPLTVPEPPLPTMLASASARA